MGVDKTHVHKPGPYKQTNKAHKHGRHRSKGMINVANKGKVSVKAISKKARHELNREERRNQAHQIRQNKRTEVLAKKRCIGGLEHTPFLVCLVPLSRNTDAAAALEHLVKCDREAIISKSPTGVTHICIPRFKQRFSFIIPSIDNELGVLDALKVADTVMFLMTASGGSNEDAVVDKWGQNILMAAFAQGLPTPMAVLTDLDVINPKRRHEYKQQIQKLLVRWLPDEKLMTLDNSTDAINVLRKIGGQKQKPVIYRDRRPHIYADEVSFILDDAGPYGTLKVTGYLRGAPLSANGLVHLPGIGDFQMSQIEAPQDPYSQLKDKSSQVPTKVLDRSDPAKREPLDAENIPNPMDAEQTWPTAEEIEMAEQEQTQNKNKKTLRGWSEFNAAWIPDGDDDEDDDDESSIEDDEAQNSNCEYMDTVPDKDMSDSDDDDNIYDADTLPESDIEDAKYDEKIDSDEERAALEKIKAAAKEDQMFPDEIDTPHDQLAKVRFQKYRGLKSFMKSPWDINENLPSDYTRIYQFHNFKHIKKEALKQQEETDGAQPGWYVTVHVLNVSKVLWKNFTDLGVPLILFGLLPYEYKMSILNVALKRTPNYSLPIKSKDRLIFQCGYRRFAVNPVFSQHTNAQKHKFERFLQPEATAVATFYGRVQFSPSPVLCYKEQNGTLTLVASGSLLSCDPKRIILKRIVLSGHPFKIYKNSATIRFMFFNREDIDYFSKIMLRTKMGRIGEIKEPLGTHGHFKAIFEGQLKSQDTVLMNLYKRVFPKWTYEDLVVSISNGEDMEN